MPPPGNTLHRTDGHACTCEAAVAGDPVCSHRAPLRYALRWLPEPAAAAPTPAVEYVVQIDGADHQVLADRAEADALDARLSRWASTSTHVRVVERAAPAPARAADPARLAP